MARRRPGTGTSARFGALFRPATQAKEFREGYAADAADADARLGEVATALGAEPTTFDTGVAGYVSGTCNGHAFALYAVSSGVPSGGGTARGGSMRYYLELVVDGAVVWRRGDAAPVVKWLHSPHTKKPKVETDPAFAPPELDVDTVVAAVRAACAT